MRTPYYHQQPEHFQQFNRDHAPLRAPGERPFARFGEHAARPAPSGRPWQPCTPSSLATIQDERSSLNAWLTSCLGGLTSAA